ncbi:hypothetical protein M407DRAFT_240799 [Tulasnella calospora MUT 4182]|uniref:Uncharacterized protein n=1 Tax=Tulasnella calospora MUT 4182 TaxID=1051891 RepID=A0A0C3LJH2_9AGAM|nr:hypothetical protein M407DRAFT_240799 [Tulasnella calospora MUT 4182]
MPCKHSIDPAANLPFGNYHPAYQATLLLRHSPPTFIWNYHSLNHLRTGTSLEHHVEEQ